MKRKIFLLQIALFVFTGFLLLSLHAVIPMMTSPTIVASTKVFDAQGTLLFEIIPGEGAKDDVDMQTLPSFVVPMLLLSEDKRFYDHGGVDIFALFRSLGQRIFGGVQSGASTLDMQLMKITYFPREPRTVYQKFREGVAAWFFNLTHSKKQIVEEYIERAYFGSNYYGLGNAARGYFGKSPDMLSVQETAALIALLPSPDETLLYSRPPSFQYTVENLLDRSVQEGVITSEQRDREKSYVPLPQEKKREKKAPHFVDYVLTEVAKKYPDVYQGGYSIYTTLQYPSQVVAEKYVAQHVLTLSSKHVTNGAVVRIVPETGAIESMVGSVNYFSTTIPGMFNVTTAKRQPGSSLKPFTYLAAFLQGYAPAAVVNDVPAIFTTAKNETYAPKNYDLLSHGPVSLRTALGSSLNVPAVKVLDMIGFDAFYDVLRHFGITFEHSPEYYGLGITLGGGEVTLLELTHAYSMLANGGKKTEVHAISSIQKNGNVVYTFTQPEPTKVIDVPYLEESIAMLTDVLKDPSARTISFGLASRLNISPQVAVKTGTTKDFRDNLAFGYTQDITVGVWVGNNDNSPMEGVSGISGAIPILHDVMKSEPELIAKEARPLPSSLVYETVCMISGKKATALCPQKRREMFLPGKAPTEFDTWYVEKDVDLTTNTLANEHCKDNTVKQVFLQVPAELMGWAKHMRMNLLPTTYCDGSQVVSDGYIVTSPEEGAVFLLKKDLPRELQKIPVSIEGRGSASLTLEVNGVVQEQITSLPYTLFLDLPTGTHTLKIGTIQRTFRVQDK